VKNDGIVTPEIELEPQHLGHSCFQVTLLCENAEGKHEYRVVGIDAAEAMISALVDVYNIVAELHCRLTTCRALSLR
jgi:hypothetical protein